ncbi:MAG: DUF1318 domain-containing protein [Acidobacteria bacterium]|nr:DUF1318 domain-containing protein [Acidobacteriota bacterium]
MNARCPKVVFSVGLCAAILGAMAAVACADTKEEIVERMAKRLGAVKKCKAEGKIGETFDGLVDAVKAQYLDDKSLKKLVADENADRKAFYALGAKKYGTTPEAFALSAGRRNFREARPEDWLKPKDGKWVQKKDLKD